MFRCPICKKNLFKEEKSYICENGHCFDISKENYVNLLPANQKNSLNPGDDKAMVNARFNFLSLNYYQCLSDALCELAVKYTQKSTAVLDSGCGEGYYTNKIYDSLIKANKSVFMAGIDISKWAVRLASKHSTGTDFAVGSVFHLPISDNSIEFLINCFSPLCLEEFHRVLKNKGYFAYVVPSPKHLWELKEQIYESPYENEEKTEQYEDFSYIEKKVVEKKVFLPSNQVIKDLFMMTPYAWKTSKQALKKLDEINSLEITIGFHIHIYQKID
ncbi:MAG: methyltransferase domain-containing protein [Oscillospiraceae bacterium]